MRNFRGYMNYMPQKSKAMMYFIVQRRLRALGFQETGREKCYIVKAGKATKLFTPSQFIRARRLANCDLVLMLISEEVLTQYTEAHKFRLREYRQQAAKYVHIASKMFDTFGKYPSLVKTMVEAFQEENQKE
eukprot:snap_masked-scaffold_21-processed-gene-3.41-mRNA-1 protein AED:1.00 eAED:1.00 QI:0/-1/0/0/-1/1/1/0/131